MFHDRLEISFIYNLILSSVNLRLCCLLFSKNLIPEQPNDSIPITLLDSYSGKYYLLSFPGKSNLFETANQSFIFTCNVLMGKQKFE